jgi:hypothetical protein
VRIWNALVGAGLVSGVPLKPEAGVVLTNGELNDPPLARGFDWRVKEVPGVRAAETAPGLRFRFSGRQEESCELMAQALPLEPGRRYRLAYEYRAEQMRPRVEWRIAGAVSPALASEEWRRESVEFTVPRGMEMAWLSLAYRREPGTTRTEGTVWLRRVSVDPVHLGGGTAPPKSTVDSAAKRL